MTPPYSFPQPQVLTAYATHITSMGGDRQVGQTTVAAEKNSQHTVKWEVFLIVPKL